ncbi:hypothetical protein, partial [Salinivibrio socompensis]|uniref:hypothetical protein n=1 Tax=Salinivibrio socompensis TaxID=1510206 RepID=UPI001969D17C
SCHGVDRADRSVNYKAQLKVEEATFPTLTLEQLEEGKVRPPVPSFSLDDDSDLGWTKDTLIISSRG